MLPIVDVFRIYRTEGTPGVAEEGSPA